MACAYQATLVETNIHIDEFSCFEINRVFEQYKYMRVDHFTTKNNKRIFVLVVDLNNPIKYVGKRGKFNPAFEDSHHIKDGFYVCNIQRTQTISVRPNDNLYDKIYKCALFQYTTLQCFEFAVEKNKQDHTYRFILNYNDNISPLARLTKMKESQMDLA